MKNKQKTNPWISFSDIMTGLMVIFMFIAISYILEVQKKQAERDNLFKDFQATKEELYLELDSIFKEDFEKWNVELDKDLSIKFTNPDILFASGSSNITKEFKEILDVFFPKYLGTILKPKFADKISEVRIEGHTDTIPVRINHDAYIGNTILSQQRSTEVLAYLRNLECYQQLTTEQEKRLQFWLTANGLSYGRTIDNEKQLTAISGKQINNDLSRRVEFRIVTTSESLVEQVIKELQKK